MSQSRQQCLATVGLRQKAAPSFISMFISDWYFADVGEVGRTDQHPKTPEEPPSY